jgi:hypothetical protein
VFGIPTHICRYESQIEDMIAKGLPKDVPLADFMAALPAYMEGPGGKKEETAKAVSLLLEVSWPCARYPSAHMSARKSFASCTMLGPSTGVSKESLLATAWQSFTDSCHHPMQIIPIAHFGTSSLSLASPCFKIV